MNGYPDSDNSARYRDLRPEEHRPPRREEEEYEPECESGVQLIQARIGGVLVARYECRICGDTFLIAHAPKFCPECGVEF